MALKLPIIVPTCEIGRLGNALLSGAHTLAFCLEHDLYFTHLWFERFANDFPATRYSLFCSRPSFPWFPVPRSCRGWAFNLARFLKRLIPGRRAEVPTVFSNIPECVERRITFTRIAGKIGRYDINLATEVRLDEPSFFDSIHDCWIVNLRGWRYRAPRLVEKQAAIIRQHFRPNREIENAATTALEQARRESDVVIGLHVRQTDYQSWQEGNFFYSGEDYLQLMRHLITLFPHQRVKFLICSDQLPESIRSSDMPFVTGPGSPLTDIYSLAQCDYLVGPPSTFSLWASFYGQKPLCHVEKATARPSLSDFAVATQLTWKYDGL